MADPTVQQESAYETELERRPQWRVAGVIFFGLFALALLWAAFKILWPFMTAILLAVILVILTFGIFRRVRTRMKGNSTRAALVMLLGITIVLVIPAVLLSVLLVQQAQGVVERVSDIEAQEVLQRVNVAQYLAFIKHYVPGFDPATVSPQRLLLPALQRIPGWVAAHGGQLLGGIAGGIVGFFLVMLAMFFFYTEGETILDQLSILSPLPRRYDNEFRERFKDVIDATFRGQLFTGIAQGIATGIGLAIAGVPGAAFWGAVAAILSLVPMVGAAAVWVPAAIYLFVTAGMGNRPFWQPIFLVAWGVLVVSLIDNIVRPWAMKGKAQLPAIPLLFAVLGGLQAFGFVGLVIGPLVFSLLMSIIEIYKKSFSATKSAVMTST
ncbi:MAG TPA: AI-2E family transporter [Thermoanaerobaculia bacterium]